MESKKNLRSILERLNLLPLMKNFKRENVTHLDLCKLMDDASLERLGLVTIGDRVRFRDELNRELDCGDCMWNKDATYLGCNDDCAKYVQCTQYGRNSIEQHCPHGLLWSSGKVQCVQPHLSECDPCDGKPTGSEVSYSLSCREYWKCKGGGRMELRCCDDGLVFVSGLGCVSDYTKSCVTGCLSPKFNQAQCDALVNVTFSSLSSDEKSSISQILPENVNNGHANMSHNSAIAFPELSDVQWAAPFYIYIGLHLSLATSIAHDVSPQAILHNAGCSTKEKPTLLITMDSSTDFMRFTFGVVLTSNPEMLFLNITSKKSQYNEIRLGLEDEHLTAEVNGRKSTVQFETKETIAKTSNSLQVGGDICIYNYKGFNGDFDQVIIDKCVRK